MAKSVDIVVLPSARFPARANVESEGYIQVSLVLCNQCWGVMDIESRYHGLYGEWHRPLSRLFQVRG